MDEASMQSVAKSLGLDTSAQDNVVSYEVFPHGTDATAVELEALRAQLLQHVLTNIADYIWQRERFNLHPSLQRRAPWQQQSKPPRQGASGASPEASESLQPHLWGSVNFGDNIEDEWFVVWLLLELTRAFPITARAWDNDGEFLLIEAAYSLPRWLKPETARNRLWLHGGALHIVPLPRARAGPAPPASPTVAQALGAVRGGGVDTLAVGGSVQSALAPRLSGWPARAIALMHRAAAVLPARVAHVLRREPQLVAAAVEAFHYRDPEDMRAASRMAAFPPEDLVPASVMLSRCLYAQVALQHYRPPKGWPPLPLPSDPGFAAAELGAKLTAGFEMVCSQRDDELGAPVDPAPARAEGGAGRSGEPAGAAAAAAGPPGTRSDAALTQTRGWEAYAARLEALGYFGGELPGSIAHAAAMRRALQEYRRSTERYLASTEALETPARRVRQLLREPVDAAELRAASEAAPPPDGEAWLWEGGAELDAELAQRQGEVEAHQRRRRGGPAAAAVSAAAPEEYDPTALSTGLQRFMEAYSGAEGAEMPAEGVAFDEARFAAELQRALGMAPRGGGGGGGARPRDGSDDEAGTQTSEEGSSFFSGSATWEDSEDEEGGGGGGTRGGGGGGLPTQAEWAALSSGAGRRGSAEDEEEEGERWETQTATDSDDAFAEGYGRVLDEQLGGTSMAHTFERARGGGGGGAAAHPARGSEVPGVGTGESGADGGHVADDVADDVAGDVAALRPVDLDVNLVSGLLASYREQGGLPGPASNLAALLGIALPEPDAL